MTDQELKDLVARLAQETSRLQKLHEENEKEMKRVIKAQAEAGKQIGGLGNTLGRFAEGLIYPSMEKVLRRRFKVNFVAPRVRVRRNGTEIELDAFGYSNGDRHEAYIVEIKSSFGEDEFQQLLKTLDQFPKFFPEHSDKNVYGVAAAVDMAENIRRRLLKAGIYVARIHNNICTLQVPRGFKAKAFHRRR